MKYLPALIGVSFRYLLFTAFVSGLLTLVGHAQPASLATPTISILGANQVTFTFQSSATGTGYFTLLTDSETAGTAVQTAAGQKSTGATAFRHGSLPLTADTDGTYTVHNLTENTHYTVCFTADDGSTLAADVDASVSFTTATVADQTGKNWAAVGPAGFSAGGTQNTSLAFAPDGMPCVGYRDSGNGGKATVMRFNGTAWETVGTAGFSAGGVLYLVLAIAPDGTPYVAYLDMSVSNKATVMKFNGTAWETVGTAGFSAGTAVNTSLAFAPDGSPYVLYSDSANSSKATVMKYNGAAWVAVGTAGFSPGRADYPSLAIAPDGTPNIAYRDGANSSKATVLQFNGTAWETVGSAGFSDDSVSYTSLAFAPDGSPCVAYTDAANSSKATVMRFNGAAWVPVGAAGFSAGQADYTSLAFAPDGTPCVTYRDVVNSIKATVMKFDGSSWVPVGSAGLSAGTVNDTSLAFAPNGTPYVVFRDNANSGKATVMTLAPAATSVDVPGDGTYLEGQALDFTVHFSSAVTVDFSGGRPRIALDIGGTTVYADYFSGSGTTALVFRYGVQSDVGDSDGITVGVIIDLHGGTILTTVGGNPVSLLLSGVAATGAINVGTPPTLTAPTTGNLGANQVTFTFQSSATGTGYFTLLTDSETAGTTVQTAAGQNDSTTIAYRHGSLPLTASTNGTYTVRNLTENTHYTVCFTADDGSTLAAGVDATVSFTTAAATNLTGPVWNLVGMPDLSSVSEDLHMVLAPDGTPYVGYLDFATNKAAVLRFNGAAWVTVGPAPFSAGMIYDLSMAFAPDGTPYVAYQDVANDFKTTVMKFNGTAWVPVGPAGFSPDQASSTSLAFAPDGSPYVAFVGPFMGSGGAETVMKFNGSNWVLVGTAGFAGAISTNLAFGPDGAPYVVFSDGAEFGAATAMKFNGSNWVLVGTPGFSIVEATDLSLAFAPNGTPYVCYTDDNARVMKFNGSDWEKIGSGNISVEDSKYPAMAFAPDGALYVSYQDGVNHSKATVRKFPSGGTDWETVGSAGFSADQAYTTNLAMAPDGVPYIAFQRLGQMATVMKLAQSVPAYTVISTKFYGPGGLNEALNLTVSGGTITFAPSFSGQTYSPDDLSVPCILAPTKDVIIDGSTLAQHVKLSGSDWFPVVIIGPGTTARLVDLDIVHGNGAIYGGYGGGIINCGTLILRNCTLADNTTTDSGWGGGFWNWGGTMQLKNCTLTRNTAGAGGGGINDGGSLTLQNCTLSGNQATGTDPDMGGGAIFNKSGDTVLDHCTITGNTAASPHEATSGLWILDGTLTLTNSIVANNGAGTDNFSVTGGTFTSQGYNLSNDWNSQTMTTGDLTGDPLLDALADNGGRTQTCALPAGSPAINAAGPDEPHATDQRGISRPQFGRSDIGAFEVNLGVPAFGTDPANQTVAAGATATFSAAASGNPAPTYKWQRSPLGSGSWFDLSDNATYGGTATDTLTVVTTLAMNTDAFRCVATNSVSSAISAAATLAVTSLAYTAPTSDGYGAAASGGGTGSPVVVLTAADFMTQAESTTPGVITVAGTFYIGTVNVASDKTIQGADANATLVGNLALGAGVSNVVIRGLHLTNPGPAMIPTARTADMTFSGRAPGGNALTIAGASKVFVNHCTFFDNAGHDIEIVSGSDNITVSWCEFYNSSAPATPSESVLIGTTTESQPLHVTLHHNWWSANVGQHMPFASYGYVHLYSNYFNAAGNTAGSVASDRSQFFSERNVYAGMASPMYKQNLDTTLAAGKIRSLGNVYSSCTGTAPDAGTDAVFTPAYSYEMLPASDVATEVAALAGNIAGAAATDATPGTAAITGPAAAVTPGTSFTLRSVHTGFTPTAYQWRLNNMEIANATDPTYTSSNTQAANAGTYTVAINMASEDTAVSAPFVVTLGAPAPTVTPVTTTSGGGGSGSFEAWFCGALALLGSLRFLRRRH